jgi:phage shock protein C
VNERLYRSRSDRMLAGVAGGVADRFDLDPSLVRVLWAILVLLSGGIFLVIYIVMAIVVPEEPVGLPGAGWSSAGPSGWSTSWPAASGAVPDPSGPPSSPPPDPLGGAAPPSNPSGPGFAAPGPAAPGLATPGPGSWTAPGSTWSEDPARSSRRAARDARRAARRAGRGYASGGSGAGGIVAGLVLVVLGAYFLVRTFAPQIDVDRYWPAGLIVLGVVLVALSIRRTAGEDAP